MRTDTPAKEQFFERLKHALADCSFLRLNISAPTSRDPQVRSIHIRPVRIREENLLSFVYRHATRDITKNFAEADALALLDELIGNEFLSAFLSTTAEVAQLGFRKGRPARLILSKPETTAGPDLRHDRVKRKSLEGRPNWLEALGVTNQDGSVRPGMEAKFRQIQRFVEILGHLLDELPGGLGREPRLADMGCGKGYLTFAAYEYLKQRGAASVRAQGIEVRPELAAFSQKVAGECGCAGLNFIAGDIASMDVRGVDILLALHACDTATDEAIAKGVQAKAALIVVAPCCHKELRPQIKAPPVLAPALRHGIFEERTAEWVTDALRAQLLEWAGYSAKVFEFISSEHTSKNIMIAAIRRNAGGDSAAAERQITELAAFFGIQHQRLAEALNFPGLSRSLARNSE
jgi:SAM-dependent methyltransferase